MPDWTVRFIRKDDEEGLLSLLQAAFDRWPAAEIDVPPLEHLRWKLHGDPLAEQHHIVVEGGGRIVGGRIFFVQRAKVRDRIVLSYTGLDNAVLPGYRQKGMGSEMVEYRLDEFRRIFDIKLGMRTRLPSSTRIGDRIGAELLGNALRTLVAPVTAVRAVDEPSATCSIRAAARFDERLDGLWAVASKPFDFIIQKTAAYANWRYGDPRAGRFTIVLAEQGEHLLGYAVVSTSRGKGHIADVLVLPDRPDVVQHLAVEAVRGIKETGATEVECALPARHPYRRALHAVGFSDGKRRIRPNFVPTRLPFSELAFLTDRKAAVHVTPGDFDFV